MVKNDTKNVINENIDGSIINNSEPNNLPIENYNDDIVNIGTGNILKIMHDRALLAKDCAEANFGVFIKVTPIEQIEDNNIIVNYFIIENMNSRAMTKSYAIYNINNTIYYRSTEEFYQIIKNYTDGIEGCDLSLLKFEYARILPIEAFDMLKLKEDCMFLINSIVDILTGKHVIIDISISESCKIRRPKLTNGHDFEQSKFADDILRGDKEKRDFEEKIEKDTQKAGVENPLAPVAPPQEESTHMILPNAHSITELYDITYEPMDKVIYKDNHALVLTVAEDGETISILQNGETIEVKYKDLEPDPSYFNDLSNTPQLFDFDKNNLAKDATNEKPLEMKDLNKKTIACNIIVDGHKINIYECYASLQDVMDSKNMIHVLYENGQEDEFNMNNIEFTEKPYAVIVNSEGKPVRTITVDPESYISADENDLVNCTVADKLTQFPKKVIKILS